MIITTITITRASITIFLSSLFLTLTCNTEAAGCKAWLVQSIPTDMPDLPRIPGILSTADVFQWLAGNSSENLDIIALKWQLLSQPANPKSGDYGYSQANMEKFGANAGFQVYQSIQDTADRNVGVRILQHSGVYPDYTEESSMLASGRPNVENVTLLLTDWWESSGGVHSKVWISDHKHFYIGSADNDWKSLTQVKEVGIYVVDCPRIAEKVEDYFNNLWKLASLNSSDYTKTVWDQQWQVYRKVPCWSHFIRTRERCRSPLPRYLEVPHVAGYPTLADPHIFEIPIETPGYSSPSSSHKNHSSYLSFAPPELLFGTFQTDEQAWVDTITSVGWGETVRISAFDWLGQSQSMEQPVYWSSISSAISEVVFSKHAKVQILITYWPHKINNTEQYLYSLLYSNILCSSSKYNHCTGKIEIKYYNVPGFSRTGAAIINGLSTDNIYPGKTRVNHAKYVVSNSRAHIGTSNFKWDHFYTTSGVSFGTYNPAIVSQLQEIFDADWNSPYTVPFKLQEGALISYS
ncbi:hypothetical protein AQUCO_03400198v1 [Aquilegia coerulea]|uniref:PLD phosphodiesterase domain-containing protein n=1 Tax=Aquilegia coerulea TaxID=218851 RepID=A0A2G5CXY3_AQUCA|nr:hypothetical protein AQUCO_03400198v1 [Aquilegia coerulea]